MRKHFIKLILVILISITFGISNVKASCGDLVYDVLDMKITNEKIVVDGWAFIHHTQNGKNTNQQIKINLCNEDGICYFDDSDDSDDDNGIINGSGFNFNGVMAYNRIVEYNYQNIGFKQEFAIEKIKNRFGNSSGTQKLYFTIAVTNDDYNNRHSNCQGTKLFNDMVETTHDYTESGKYWVKEKLKILDTVISGSIKNDETIEVTADGTDKLLYTGWHTISGKYNGYTIHIGWGQIYKYNGTQNSPKYISDNNGTCANEDSNPGEYIIKAKLTKNLFYSYYDDGNVYYTCANYDKKGKNEGDYIYLYEYEYRTESDKNKGFFCNDNNCPFGRTDVNPILSSESYKCGDTVIEFKKSKSYAKVYGETTLTIKIKEDKKCKISEPSSDSKSMSCNDWTKLSSTCDELTVKEGNSSAVVKITQDGYISNIFKSNLVNADTEYNANSYDGGWFQYAIVYRNEVSFNINSLSGSETDINNVMQSRIKNLSSFQDNIELVINGLENITGTKLIKKCTQSGDFKDGNTLVTTCTFFLPSSEVKGLGKVTYSENETDANVTNKYYIDFNENEHKVSVTLKNLSRLSDNKDDSKDKSKVWFGTWEVKTDCNLKVTNRLIKTDDGSSGDGKTKYKFIYRPIDLKNPFPNSRFPGVNWYSWYKDGNNKERLEKSYNKVNYSVELDNKTISEIKEYNKKNNYFGSVDKDFFKEYIKEGGSQ